jgi:MFS family permease
MLMNMSSPIYSTFVMEQVDPESRGMLASLTNMAWNFGWALSPTVSGYLQIKYGFGPPFMLTILLYSVAILMYYFWFLRPSQAKSEQQPA